MLTLDNIVSSYLSANERPQSEYRRLYDIALRGFKFMQLHKTGLPETVELDVLANKTATLPADVLTVIEIGWQDDTGHIVPLTQNSSMTMLNSTSTTRLSQAQIPNPATTTTTNLVPVVGDRIQLGYSYKIDYDNSRIVLDYDFPESTIVVKYLPMFSEQSEDYVVSEFFEEALIAFLYWQDSKRAKNTNADREQNRRDFYNEFRIASQAIQPFSLRELYETYKRKLSLGNNVI